MKFVVKVSGKLLTPNEEALPRAVGELLAEGAQVVVVHGGGPQLSEVLQKMGKVPQFVDGLRVTPKEEMDVIEMVFERPSQQDAGWCLFCALAFQPAGSADETPFS